MGLEMAPILDPSVVKTFTDALESEFKARGFSLGEGNVVVTADLTKFYNDFKMGFFAADAVAELSMGVQVKKPDGTLAFAKTVRGQGTNPNVILVGGEEAKAALEQALRDGLKQLFSNKEFIDALTGSGAAAGASPSA
jgi:uncharacterized lipoprotein YajG